MTPLWIIDEAQNLPREFFRDFPAFLNFALRPQRDLITVWLVGHPTLAQLLERAVCGAMRLAVPKGLNHLPDELLQRAIGELQ